MNFSVWAIWAAQGSRKKSGFEFFWATFEGGSLSHDIFFFTYAFLGLRSKVWVRGQPNKIHFKHFFLACLNYFLWISYFWKYLNFFDREIAFWSAPWFVKIKVLRNQALFQGLHTEKSWVYTINLKKIQCLQDLKFFMVWNRPKILKTLIFRDQGSD